MLRDWLDQAAKASRSPTAPWPVMMVQGPHRETVTEKVGRALWKHQRSDALRTLPPLLVLVQRPSTFAVYQQWIRKYKWSSVRLCSLHDWLHARRVHCNPDAAPHHMPLSSPLPRQRTGKRKRKSTPSRRDPLWCPSIVMEDCDMLAAHDLEQMASFVHEPSATKRESWLDHALLMVSGGGLSPVQAPLERMPPTSWRRHILGERLMNECIRIVYVPFLCPSREWQDFVKARYRGAAWTMEDVRMLCPALDAPPAPADSTYMVAREHEVAKARSTLPIHNTVHVASMATFSRVVYRSRVTEPPSGCPVPPWQRESASLTLAKGDALRWWVNPTPVGDTAVQGTVESKDATPTEAFYDLHSDAADEASSTQKPNDEDASLASAEDVPLPPHGVDVALWTDLAPADARVSFLRPMDMQLERMVHIAHFPAKGIVVQTNEKGETDVILPVRFTFEPTRQYWSCLPIQPLSVQSVECFSPWFPSTRPLRLSLSQPGLAEALATHAGWWAYVNPAQLHLVTAAGEYATQEEVAAWAGVVQE